MSTYVAGDGELVKLGTASQSGREIAYDSSGTAIVYRAASGDTHDFEVDGTVEIELGAKGVTAVNSVDSAIVADEVSFGRYEIGAGNTVISLSQETAVAGETDETKFSHKVQMRINGATYFVMLTDS